MIWYLDWADQNIWKTLYSNNSYDHTHKKQIYNQLYSSDKMMVEVTKTLIILCLMMFHSTKMKNDLIFGLSRWKHLKTLYSNNSYDQTHKKQKYNQLYSSDKMMVHLTKTHTISCLMIFQSTKIINDLIFGFSTSKQLENNIFQKFVCSHTLETIFQPTLQ